MTRAILVIVVACGSPSAPPPIVSGRANDEAPARAAAADRAYEASIALDFRAPDDTSPRLAARERAATLYLEACRAGDPRSCWRHVVTASTSARTIQEAAIATGKHCLRGDHASCSAIGERRKDLVAVSPDGTEPDLRAARELCTAGLGAACHVLNDSGFPGDAEPDPALYERGCQLGDSMSCEQLAFALDDGFELDRARARHAAAAEAECKRGIVRGCRLADGDRDRTLRVLLDACRSGLLDACTGQHIDAAPDATKLAAYRVECDAAGEYCKPLSDFTDDKTLSRHALEQGCQHRRLESCVWLVEEYRNERLAEPVAGRADAVAAWVCKRASAEDVDLLTGDTASAHDEMCKP